MFEDGIAKTAFKSHEGHYVLVFSSKFTLVFFDDILVYSPRTHDTVEGDFRNNEVKSALC